MRKETVTIFVGLKRKEYTIHKDLICSSANFFKCAFNGPFTESKDGTMYLPDESADAFGLYIEWVYRKHIAQGHSESYLYALYDLYIMADKLCLTELKDLTMDTIQDVAHHHDLYDVLFVKDQVLKVFHSTTEHDGGLAMFLLYIIVHTFFWRMHTSATDNPTIFGFTAEDNRYMWELTRDDYGIADREERRVG